MITILSKVHANFAVFAIIQIIKYNNNISVQYVLTSEMELVLVKDVIGANVIYEKFVGWFINL